MHRNYTQISDLAQCLLTPNKKKNYAYVTCIDNNKI